MLVLSSHWSDMTKLDQSSAVSVKFEHLFAHLTYVGQFRPTDVKSDQLGRICSTLAKSDKLGSSLTNYGRISPACSHLTYFSHIHLNFVVSDQPLSTSDQIKHILVRSDQPGSIRPTRADLTNLAQICSMSNQPMQFRDVSGLPNFFGREVPTLLQTHLWSVLCPLLFLRC